MKLHYLLLSLLPLLSPAQDPLHFDYFTNNWNVAGLKDYTRGARISPDNRIFLDESNGTVEILFGKELKPLSRKQDKSAWEGWMPIFTIPADEGGIHYEYTVWATPMPTVKDPSKAFDWPSEGENFTVWVKYKLTNTSNQPAQAKTIIRKIPECPTGIHYVDIRLNPGESIEQAARYPFFPIADDHPLIQADYHSWLQQTVDYWNRMKSRIASIEVPEEKANEALKAAHVCQMIANDLGEVRGGEGFYDQFYIRDGAYQVMELEEAGLWDAARKSVELYLPRQREDGRFESQPGQFDANGQAQWVLWQYFKISADTAFLRRVFPVMQKAAEWTVSTLKKTATDTAFPGLLPAALADGEYLWAGKNHIVGYDFWNLRGLLITADAARILGNAFESDRLTKAATRYRNAINAAMVKTGLNHFPPSWEEVGTHWGNTETLWPTPIFEKNDPRITNLIEFLRHDFGGGYVEGTLRWMGAPNVIHPYLGAYTTMADLTLGNDERVVRDFYYYLLHSTAAHAFPEGIFYKTNTAWWNTIPHVTGACNYAIMLRHMLVHEEGDELHLLKAVPDGWLGDGKHIRIERLPTWFGNVSLTVTGNPDGVRIDLDNPSRNKPARIVIYLPENRKLTNDLPGVTVVYRKPQTEQWDFNRVVSEYRKDSAHRVSTVRFGVMADVHKDIMFDADRREKAFIKEMTAIQPDFIIELGDFCQPKAQNQEFMNIWDAYPGSRYTVLGNHDMDGGFTRDSSAAFLHAPGRYYSFDKEGFHFVILDANETNPSPSRPPGYAHYIGREQQDWLRQDLARARYPTVVFSHQPLDNRIDNPNEILDIFTASAEANPGGRVIACFNGHNHADDARQTDGIWFVEINSMSYDWLGESYAHPSYPDSIMEKYPYIKYTAPYKDPLWALVTIRSDGKIIIHGKKSGYVGKSPEELHVPARGALHFSSAISDRVLEF